MAAQFSPTSTPTAYAIEDKITDYLDNPAVGYVELNPTNVYVSQLSDTTTNGAIQRGVNVAPSLGTVNVQAGVFVGELDIETPITLEGAQAGNDPNPSAPATGNQTIIEPDTSGPNPYAATDTVMINIGVNGVTIDGVTVNGSNPNLVHYVDPTTHTDVVFNGVPIDAAEGIVSYNDVGSTTIKNDIIKDTAYDGVDLYNFTSDAPTSNNYITDNLIQNLSDAYGFGVGIILYNNFYAQVTDNVMNNVTVGIQTGNFSQANNDATFSPEISNNQIAASGVGIFYNLMYDGSSTITVSDNAITAVNSAANAPWQGVLLNVHPGPNQRIVPEQHHRRFKCLYVRGGPLFRIRGMEYSDHRQRADFRRYGFGRGLRRVGEHLRRLQQQCGQHAGNNQRHEHQRQPDRRLCRR